MRSWTDEQFIDAVKSSITYSEICRKLNINVRQGNFVTIKKYIKIFNLSIDHLLGKSANKGKPNNRGGTNIIPLEKILIDNSMYHNTTCLKIRLIKGKLLKNKCELCGMEAIWRNVPLMLQLDHINGNRFDQRIENLRLLCPNCHSQTKTFCGKHLKINHTCTICGKLLRESRKSGKCSNCYKSTKEKVGHFCVICGKELINKRKTGMCITCRLKSLSKTRKVERPSYEQLKKELSESNFSILGKKYGVSGVAIKKWLMKYEQDDKNSS